MNSRKQIRKTLMKVEKNKREERKEAKRKAVDCLER